MKLQRNSYNILIEKFCLSVDVWLLWFMSHTWFKLFGFAPLSVHTLMSVGCHRIAFAYNTWRSNELRPILFLLFSKSIVRTVEKIQKWQKREKETGNEKWPDSIGFDWLQIVSSVNESEKDEKWLFGQILLMHSTEGWRVRICNHFALADLAKRNMLRWSMSVELHKMEMHLACVCVHQCFKSIQLKTIN